MARSTGRLFFAAECDEAAGRAVLLDGEAHHARRVLRLRSGDEVGVLYGGRKFPGVLDGGSEVVLMGPGESQALPRVALHVGVARPKAQAAAAIVEAATELGVSHIAFFASERSVTRTPGGVDRWRRIACEACKQCGSYQPPDVAEPADLSAWMAGVPPDAVRLRLAEAGEPARALAAIELGCCRAAAVLCGPEGGLSPDEVSAAVAAGFAPVSLGPLVLRVEIAAIAAISRLAPGIWREE